MFDVQMDSALVVLDKWSSHRGGRISRFDYSLFGEYLPNTCKNSFVIFPNFFLTKLPFLKVGQMEHTAISTKSSILDVRLGSEYASGWDLQFVMNEKVCNCVNGKVT